MEAATLYSIFLVSLAYNRSCALTQSSGRDVYFGFISKSCSLSQNLEAQLVSTISITQNENNIFRFEDYLSVQHGGEGGQGECSFLAFTPMVIGSKTLV